MFSVSSRLLGSKGNRIEWKVAGLGFGAWPLEIEWNVERPLNKR
jgi:hypothetical protein